MERTLVLVKPDGVQRGLVGAIIDRLERRGLKLVGMKMLQMDGPMAESHYAEHKGKPFFPGLVSFITSGPLVAMALEGRNAISAVRQTVGATDPGKAAAGTIRGDFGLDTGRNLIHASASPEDASRELRLFFSDKELLSYRRDTDRWITES